MARFAKGFLKYISCSIAITLVFGIILFFISPNIVDEYELILATLFLVSLILIMLLVIGLIKGELKMFRIKNRPQSFLLLLIVITCVFSTGIMIILNDTINEVTVSLYNKDSITVWDKIDLFNKIGENLKNDYRAKQYSNDMESQAYEHIIFYYFPDDEELVKELINKIEPLDKMIDSFIPTYDIEPVNVILYNDESKYRKATGTPQNSLNVGLFYKNTIHLVNAHIGQQIVERVGREGFSIDDIVSIFAHEYSHYKCNAYFAENNIEEKEVPRWLEEGLACYFKYALNDTFPILEMLDLDPSLDSLVTPTQWEKYGDSEIGVHYIKAYMAVYRLIEMKDEGVFRDIVNLLNGERSFDEAFKTVVGLSVKEFEEKVLLP